jgi:hypothetical protein
MAVAAAVAMSGGGVKAEAEDGKEKLNPIAEGVAAKGVVQCVDRVNQVTRYIGFGQGAGASLLIPGEDPDQRMVPLSMEISVPGVGPAYVAATFAPGQANGCGAVYDAVIYSPLSCEDLAKEKYDTFEDKGVVRQQIRMLVGGASTRVFLMPAGTGCISIKKELVL